MPNTIRKLKVWPGGPVVYEKEIHLEKYSHGAVDISIAKHAQDDTTNFTGTFGLDDAKRLRDALIELYPVEKTIPANQCIVGIPGCKCASPPKPSWETVADGLDRIKVPGGWIYQNIEDQMLFVADVK